MLALKKKKQKRNRPISLNNIDFKIIYKTTARKLHYDNVKFISGIKGLFLIENLLV